MQASSVSYLERILGAAIFDENGLPKQYYISVEDADISWVQTIFQTLGIQVLLNSAFQLQGFSHAVIQGTYFHAIIIWRQNRYVALLIRQTEPVISEDVIEWATEFDPTQLATDPRFSAS